MTIYKEFRVGGGGGSPFGFLGPLLVLALVFTGLFFLASGVFKILSFLSIGILIAIVVIDYKVLVDYVTFVLKLLKENTVMGIIAVLIAFFGYPFILGYLLLKALGKRQINKFSEKIKQEQNTFTDYQEVDDDVLELPRIDKRPQQQPNDRNEYDDMFK